MRFLIGVTMAACLACFVTVVTLICSGYYGTAGFLLIGDVLLFEVLARLLASFYLHKEETPFSASAEVDPQRKKHA